MSAPLVRIELSSAMSWDQVTNKLAAVETAEIRLSGADGKILRTRKPAATLVHPDRAELLRMIAGWMDSRHDLGLSELAAAIMSPAAEPAEDPS